ncbi:MAG TPA: hypothetical protein VGQ09_23150 [Chitinophagaceae bacterium]|nr:hypothetical protein [Chitinophagaceae bacterium]
MIKKILYHPFFIKLFHWEYWSFHVVYGPLYFYWLWLCLKARSFFFFNTSNPSISNGGFLMESKKQIYDLLPQKYYPRTIFFNAESSVQEILREIQKENFKFPLIGKPDIGMKGLSVKKLSDEQELIEYVAHSKVSFLIQEFVSYENEIGIFYYRFPNKLRGHISGIVKKEFLAVEGDGASTMTELLRKDKRFILQIPALKRTYGNELKRILQKGEKRILVPYGNHVRGAKFINVSHLIDEKLVNTIDKICKQVSGFYYGRLDIRFNSWEDLLQGKNISVIEINGAGSEPTHIYDPKHSIFYAWKEIIRHWNILWKISRINHRCYQLPYMKISSGIEMFRQNKEYVKMISEDLRQTA